MPDKDLRILVTNDDGILSPGLIMLAKAVAALGEVWVVAPDRERTAVAHAVTLHKPLR
ncbi:MAG TPA: 5'/3'-nucleotidase SurE, partial [Nitrospira sp.]